MNIAFGLLWMLQWSSAPVGRISSTLALKCICYFGFFYWIEQAVFQIFTPHIELGATNSGNKVAKIWVQSSARLRTLFLVRYLSFDSACLFLRIARASWSNSKDSTVCKPAYNIIIIEPFQVLPKATSINESLKLPNKIDSNFLGVGTI